VKIKSKSNNLYDRTIWILTVVLVSSFCINNKKLNGSYVLLGITILAFILSALKNNGKITCHIGIMHFFIGVFCLFCFTSAVWAINSGDAIEKGTTVFEILICISVFYWHYRCLDNPVRDLLRVLMWSGYVTVIYTFIYSGYDVIMDILNSSGRLSSSFDNVNTIGFICALTIIIAIYFTVYEKGSLSLILVIPSLLLLSACGSRKALIILFIGIILLFIFKDIGEHKFLSVLKFLSFLLVFYFAIRFIMQFSLFSGINARMEGLIALITGSGIVDHSAWVREQYIKLGISIFKDHPICGIGVGNAHIINAQTLGDNCYLHNNFVELLANGGIIGFALYYSIHFYIIFQMIRTKAFGSHEGQILFVLLLCIIMADYGFVSYYSKITYFYFMLIFIYLENINKRGLSNNVITE